MKGRKPLDATTAMAQGMDYLLRKWDGLEDTATAPRALVNPGSDDRKLDRTFTVASVDAPASVRLHSDFTCDGVNDEAEILAAIAACNGHGKVSLSTGGFYIDTSGGDVTIALGLRVLLEGVGEGTIVWFTQTGGIPVFTGGNGSKVRNLVVEQEACAGGC